MGDRLDGLMQRQRRQPLPQSLYALLRRHTRTGATAALALCTVLALRPASAQLAPEGVLQLLQPGSRPAWCTGSDPFLSSLRGETGWWASVAPSGRSYGVEARARVPLTEDATRDRGSLSESETACNLSWDGRLRGRPWAATARIASPRWEGAFRDGGARFQFDGAAMGAELGLRVADVVPGLALQATAPAWQNRDARRFLRAGLRYAPRFPLALQASIGSGRTPETVRSSYSDIGWEASLNVASIDRRFEAEVRLPARITLEGALWRADYEEDEPRDAAPVYHLAPGGRTDLHQVGARWRSAGGWGAMARWSEGRLDGRAAASWGGQRFGQLNYARAVLRARLVGAELPIGRRARLLLEEEHGHVDGQGRGNFETWPFTSTVIDLLGPRRIARADVALDWERVQLGFERGAGRASRWGLGLGWYDLRPQATLESWSPAFLVFGRTNERFDRLAWKRAQILNVSLGGKLRYGATGLHVQLQQILPLHVEKYASASQPAGGGPGVPSGTPGSSRHDCPSGTSLALAVVHHL
jgi:hypothetical protein